MLAFTYPKGDKLTKSIILVSISNYYRRGGALSFAVEDERFDFTNTKTVVVNNQLYAFKAGSPVSV